MKGKQVLFSSASEEWETPQALFDALDSEFHFNLDVSANESNRKCERFFSKDDDGLSKNWGGCVWCNPPYGKDLGKWVEKASVEIGKDADVVVMLIPSRTDTKWFHEFIYMKQNVEVRFIKGRLKFGGSKNSAPFPSMIVIFKKQ